jgi:hypothetical protein
MAKRLDMPSFSLLAHQPTEMRTFYDFKSKKILKVQEYFFNVVQWKAFEDIFAPSSTHLAKI